MKVCNSTVLVFTCTLTMIYGDHTPHAPTPEDIKALRAKCFVTDTYDKHIRPINNQSDATRVSVDFNLIHVNYLDEVSQTLQTTGWLFITWKDDLLHWDSADYGGLEFYFFPQNEIWKPDIMLSNSQNGVKELGVPSLNMIVKKNGDVWWYPYQVFESTCNIDITYFPFDVQTCSLTFLAWSYSILEVSESTCHIDITSFPFDVQTCSLTFLAWSYSILEVELYSQNGIILDQFTTNAAWTLVDTSWEIPKATDDSSVRFSIKLQRKPMHHILTLVLPSVLFSFLNIFVFVLPSHSDAKSGYAITIFLAFTVFLTIVTDTMPENSEKVAVFSIYVILQTIQSSVITMVSLLMVRCYGFDKHVTSIPHVLIVLANFGKGKLFRNRCKKNSVSSTRDTSKIKTDITEDDKGIDDETEVELQLKVYTWNSVINRLDVFCFNAFGLNIVLITLGTLFASWFGAQ